MIGDVINTDDVIRCMFRCMYSCYARGKRAKMGMAKNIKLVKHKSHGLRWMDLETLIPKMYRIICLRLADLKISPIEDFFVTSQDPLDKRTKISRF